jgi:methyl-accepting chemotaxis protein
LHGLWDFLKEILTGIEHIANEEYYTSDFALFEFHPVLSLSSMIKIEKMEATTLVLIKNLSNEIEKLDMAKGNLEKILFGLPQDIDKKIQTIDIMQNIIIWCIFIIALSLSFLVSIIFSGRISKRLLSIEQAMDRLAHKDLTYTLRLKVKDETGRLAKHINSVISTLKSIFSDMQVSAKKTMELENHLTASTSESAALVDQISSNITFITQQFESLAIKMNEVTESIALINTGTGEQVEDTAAQVSVTEDAVTAIEELTASIQSVSRLSESRKDSISGLVKVTQDGSEKIKATHKVIQEVSGELERLLEITDIINGITEQTNILSMNAAIESAHAGEAGRGFAVVAEEIQRLAEDTAENAAIINKSLREIVDRIHEADTLSGYSSETISEVQREVDTTTNALLEILQTMSEMAVGTDKVMRNSENMRTMTEEVRAKSVTIKEEAGRINETITNVKNRYIQISDMITEINSGSKTILSAMTDLNNLGQQNEEEIKALSKKIAEFKTRE